MNSTDKLTAHHATESAARAPTDPEHLTEAAVLGAMVLSPAALAGAIGILDDDDFDRESHRTLFGVLVAMQAEGAHVDHITVNDRLAATGRLDEIGGLVAVFDLTDPTACPTPAAWRSYCEIVRRHGDRRRRIVELRRELAVLQAPA